MKPTPESLARLARRLALPERGPDQAFVARVQLARRARALEQEAARDRKEQLLVEAGAGAALLLAAHQLGTVGEHAAALITPASMGLGGLALVALAGAMILSALAGEREGLA
jgi:NADPH-dependent 2,4-dienoyl-CoA reductase/sulfur reductase-like enzyme